MDRDAQRRILEGLASIYPQMADPTSLQAEVGGKDYDKNLYYLAEHGLIAVEATDLLDGGIVFGAPRITAKGMDFLEDDGGMSAILGLVTVRLHDDTIRALLIERVSAAEGDATIKGKMVSTIKSLPAEATKSVATRLIEHGLASAPRTLAELQTLLGL